MLRIHKKVREVNEIKYGELMAKLKRAKKKNLFQALFFTKAWNRHPQGGKKLFSFKRYNSANRNIFIHFHHTFA